MRWKSILLAALPAANAISLANFQLLDSNQIPYSCKVTYYAQMPSCLAADFNNGCSQVCEKALAVVAQSVIRSCRGVNADPTSLLFAVLTGGIVAAICPNADDGGGVSTGTVITISTATTTEAQTSTDASTTSEAQTTTSSTPSSDQTTSSSIITTPTPKQTSSTDSVPTPTKTSQPPQNGGDNGGPFGNGGNVNISSASVISGGSMLALVIAASACVLLG